MNEPKDNMKAWNRFNKPPPTALKNITGGRLAGKSNISPQWRYQVMTEVFGMCGIGWKYEIVRTWTEPAHDNQVFAFAEIKLCFKNDDVWSEPIPATGGSMLVEQEIRGLHANDEAYKMAITDALGTAMAKLGVAAEVYLGNYDGSKYKDEPTSEQKQQKKDMGKRFETSENIENEKTEIFPQGNIIKKVWISQEFKKDSGNPYNKYWVKTDDGVIYSTLNFKLYEIAQEIIAKKGGQCIIDAKDTQWGMNLIAIKPIETNSQQETKSPQVTLAPKETLKYNYWLDRIDECKNAEEALDMKDEIQPHTLSEEEYKKIKHLISLKVDSFQGGKK